MKATRGFLLRTLLKNDNRKKICDNYWLGFAEKNQLAGISEPKEPLAQPEPVIDSVGGLLITYKLITYKLKTDKLITDKLITKFYKLLTEKLIAYK